MPNWVWLGMKAGCAATDWPRHGPDGQEGHRGMPVFDPGHCPPGCAACVASCPTGAITADGSIAIDYGRCIVCQRCVEACPEGALTTSDQWAFAVRDRQDLVRAQSAAADEERAPSRRIASSLKGSLHIRHVDAGSCNGCESELQALSNPFYNLHRLGIFFTPSPRFADLLLVTGPVTPAMRLPLIRTWEAMPEPRMVMAAGTCAVSGAPMDQGYAAGHGLEGIVPVDVWLPGCPPNPAAFIHALLLLLERVPQKVHGGRYEP